MSLHPACSWRADTSLVRVHGRLQRRKSDEGCVRAHLRYECAWNCDLHSTHRRVESNDTRLCPVDRSYREESQTAYGRGASLYSCPVALLHLSLRHSTYTGSDRHHSIRTEVFLLFVVGGVDRPGTATSEIGSSLAGGLWAGLGGMRAWEASSAAEEDGLTAESHLRRGDTITRVFLEMLWIRHARARLRF